MSFEVGDSRDDSRLFFISVRVSFLSTCLRSKPLLACGQRALRAYAAIVEWLFVQAQYPLAYLAKLLCSYFSFNLWRRGRLVYKVYLLEKALLSEKILR